MRISDWSSDVCSSVLCRRLASALKRRGIGVGDTVSVMLPNTPAMLEAHYGVPMSGAVLNAINIRLDAATIGFILDHAEARLVIVDREFTAVMAAAIAASRSEEHTSELQSLMRISYAVFCLQKK